MLAWSASRRAGYTTSVWSKIVMNWNHANQWLSDWTKVNRKGTHASSFDVNIGRVSYVRAAMKAMEFSLSMHFENVFDWLLNARSTQREQFCLLIDFYLIRQSHSRWCCYDLENTGALRSGQWSPSGWCLRYLATRSIFETNGKDFHSRSKLIIVTSWLVLACPNSGQISRFLNGP